MQLLMWSNLGGLKFLLRTLFERPVFYLFVDHTFQPKDSTKSTLTIRKSNHLDPLRDLPDLNVYIIFLLQPI